jgi:glycosyltransferase involved in cell wall biosynthesis
MTISIVLPVYNGALYIGRTLQSLVSQTKLPMEIIVIDDASTDETQRIVREYQLLFPKIHLYSFEDNKGVSYARNYGVAQAAGDWCLFWDSDDLANRFLIEKYLNVITNKLDTVDMIFCSTQQIDGDGNVISEPTSFNEILPEEYLGYLFVRNPIVSASGVAIKISVFKDLGGFDNSIRYSEDWDLWLRVASKYNIQYLNHTLAQIRRHSSNASSRVSKMESGEKEILRRYNLKDIEEAIFCRKLSEHRNAVDFASVAFRLDNWEKGMQVLNNIDENSDSLCFFKGLYYIKNRDYLKASYFFREAIEINSNHYASRNNYACCQWIIGQKDEALDSLQRLLINLPNYMDAIHNYRLMSDNNSIDNLQGIRFTWRELRRVLTVYQGN